MTPVPQVTEHEDQGDQWLHPPSCLTAKQNFNLCQPCFLLYQFCMLWNENNNFFFLKQKHFVESGLTTVNRYRFGLNFQVPACIMTHSVCHIPAGSSLWSAQRYPHSCCLCDHMSAHAAGCRGHRSLSSGSTQTRETSHHQHSHSLKRENGQESWLEQISAVLNNSYNILIKSLDKCSHVMEQCIGQSKKIFSY